MTESESANNSVRNNSLLVFLCVLSIGIAIRIIYASCTAYTLHEHDTVSHEEYVRFVAKFGLIPGKSHCFVCYHPPLYYYLAAPIYKIAYAVSHNSEWAMRAVAAKFSVLCAIGTAIISACAAWELFSYRSGAWWRSLCLGIVIWSPGLLFLGHGINNDALLMVLSYWLFWRLVVFNRVGSVANWRWIEALNVAVFYTKGNALLSIVTSLVVLLTYKKLEPAKRLSLLFEQICVLILTCGPYVWWRVMVDGQTDLIANWTNRNDPWWTWGRLIYFNPLIVLNRPFIENPLAPAALTNPENFWEMLYRTSFFGEWQFPCQTLATCLEVCGLILLCYAVAAMLYEYRRDKINVPALATIIIQLGGLWLGSMRIGAFSALVDFRYVPVIMLPFAYYSVFGVFRSPPAFRLFGVIVALLFMLLSLAVLPYIC